MILNILTIIFCIGTIYFNIQNIRLLKKLNKPSDVSVFDKRDSTISFLKNLYDFEIEKYHVFLDGSFLVFFIEKEPFIKTNKNEWFSIKYEDLEKYFIYIEPSKNAKHAEIYQIKLTK